MGTDFWQGELGPLRAIFPGPPPWHLLPAGEQKLGAGGGGETTGEDGPSALHPWPGSGYPPPPLPLAFRKCDKASKRGGKQASNLLCFQAALVNGQVKGLPCPHLAASGGHSHTCPSALSTPALGTPNAKACSAALPQNPSGCWAPGLCTGSSPLPPQSRQPGGRIKSQHVCKVQGCILALASGESAPFLPLSVLHPRQTGTCVSFSRVW